MRWLPVGGSGGGSSVSPATTVTGPDAWSAAPVVGTSLLYARADHGHGLPANPAPSPATTVTGPDAWGAAAVVGTSTLYARADHDHGLPANPAPSPATTVTGPPAFGAAAVVGTSLLYARQDHAHGLPAAPAASLTNNTQTAAAITLAVATATTVFTTASLAVGTWLLLTSLSITGAVASTNPISLRYAVGTATATFSVPDDYSRIFVNGANDMLDLVGFQVVTVTVAGTVLVRGNNADATNTRTVTVGHLILLRIA